MNYNKNRFHKILANYFTVQPLFFDGEQQKKPHVRKCMEQPWQQSIAEMWDDVYLTLTSLDFIQIKCQCIDISIIPEHEEVHTEYIPNITVGPYKTVKEQTVRIHKDIQIIHKGIFHLLDDYEMALKLSVKPNIPLLENSTMHHLYNLLNQLSYIFIDSPDQVAPQIYNRIHTEDEIDGSFLENLDNWSSHTRTPWIRVLRKSYKKACIRGFARQSSGITACAFSPDGKKILSGSKDGVLKLWDVNSGKEIRSYYGLSVRITACAFSHDGTVIIASAGEFHMQSYKGQAVFLYENFNQDKSVGHMKIWDTLSGKELASYVFPSWITDFDLSPDGSLLAAASWDKSVKILSAPSLSKIASLDNHTAEVISCCFNPDGSMLVTCSKDSTLRIWDMQEYKEIKCKKIESIYNYIDRCVLSPDGSKILTIQNDRTACLWDIKTFKPIRKLKKLNIISCAFSPDGKYLLLGDVNGGVHQWDPDMKNELMVYADHSEGILNNGISPDNEYFISARDGTIKLWDLHYKVSHEKVEPASCHPDGIRSIKYLASSKHCILTGWNSIISIKDTTCNEVVNLKGHKSDIDVCKLDTNQTRLITSGRWENVIQLWKIPQGKKISSLKIGSGDLVFCDFTTDGKYIVVSSDKGKIILWNAEKGKKKYSICKLKSENINTIISPDSRYIITAEVGGKQILVIDLKTGKTINCLEGDYTACDKNFSIVWAFSPDSKFLASEYGNIPRSLKIWEIGTGKEIKNIKGLITGCIFSPDGQQLLTVSNNNKAQVWNTRSFSEVFTLPEDAEQCFFSPDGQRIISTNTSDKFSLWDTITGKKIISKKGQLDFNSVFSPDGRWFITWISNELFLWDTQSGDKVASLKDFTQEISALDFYPDSKQIVVGDRSGAINYFLLENINESPPLVTPFTINKTAYFQCPFCIKSGQIDLTKFGKVVSCLHCTKNIRLTFFAHERIDL